MEKIGNDLVSFEPAVKFARQRGVKQVEKKSIWKLQVTNQASLILHCYLSEILLPSWTKHPDPKYFFASFATIKIETIKIF